MQPALPLSYAPLLHHQFQFLAFSFSRQSHERPHFPGGHLVRGNAPSLARREGWVCQANLNGQAGRALLVKVR